MKEWKPKKFFTAAEVEAAMTPKGGFSRVSLAKLGVPWPPPSGWRKAITIRATAPPIPYKPVADARKRTPQEWIAMNPRFEYFFTKRDLEERIARDRS